MTELRYRRKNFPKDTQLELTVSRCNALLKRRICLGFMPAHSCKRPFLLDFNVNRGRYNFHVEALNLFARGK